MGVLSTVFFHFQNRKQMNDTLTILSHPTNLLAKTWLTDGTIKAYDDAKYFKHKAVAVANINDLSAELTKLERNTKSCVIRGSYVGEDRASETDTEYKSGRVRRIIDLFTDTPRHYALVEIDNFEPISTNPVTDAVGAIDEYIECCLPPEFSGISYHWQLSNSAGHVKHEGKLKAHVWFWLDTAYNSDQLKQWATVGKIDLDKSVLNPVQVHYTSAPVFEAGVDDPVPVRSGFAQGVLADSVALVISDEVLAMTGGIGGTVTRSEKLKRVAETDARAKMLHDRGMVKSVGRLGELRIVCPRESVHTGESGESSTVYYLPMTGGFATGHFVCKHEHCSGVAQSVFDSALGFDEFEVLTEADMIAVGKITKSKKDKNPIREIPEALHLCTDLANANRIVKHFKKHLMFSGGMWYAWVGTHWDSQSAESYSKVLRLSAIIHREADEWLAKGKLAVLGSEREKCAGIAETLEKWAVRSEMKGTVDAAMVMASKLLEVPTEKLNHADFELNCLSGMIDLRTGTVRKHDPSDFITHVINERYEPCEKGESFWEVLMKVTREDKVWAAEGRAPVASFLKRWFGYCATGLTREHKFVVHFGAGRNGKSTIIDTITNVLGPYASTAAPGLMVSAANNRHPTEIADLFGTRMVTAHESGEGGILREDFIKQATGGDRIKARFMRGDFFEFVPSHKLQLLTNYKPVIKGQDVGIWARVLLVNYAARFGTQEEMDQGIATHLIDTSILEKLISDKIGILTFIVEGAVAYFKEGLNPPDSVLSASKDYQAEQDRMKFFVEERCERGQDYKVPVSGDFGGLYPEYQNWCKESGFMPLAKNRMLQEIERLVPFFQKDKKLENGKDGTRKKITYVFGIKLVNDI